MFQASNGGQQLNLFLLFDHSRISYRKVDDGTEGERVSAFEAAAVSVLYGGVDGLSGINVAIGRCPISRNIAIEGVTATSKRLLKQIMLSGISRIPDRSYRLTNLPQRCQSG